MAGHADQKKQDQLNLYGNYFWQMKDVCEELTCMVWSIEVFVLE